MREFKLYGLHRVVEDISYFEKPHLICVICNAGFIALIIHGCNLTGMPIVELYFVDYKYKTYYIQENYTQFLIQTIYIYT